MAFIFCSEAARQLQDMSRYLAHMAHFAIADAKQKMKDMAFNASVGMGDKIADEIESHMYVILTTTPPPQCRRRCPHPSPCRCRCRCRPRCPCPCPCPCRRRLPLRPCERARRRRARMQIEPPKRYAYLVSWMGSAKRYQR